jgi:Rhodopirellula transposase DDE domain
VAAERRKKNSTIRTKIEEILRDEVAGDPVDGTRWTRKTTQSISEELFEHGIEVSANTVGRLLHEMDFSLKTNRKNIESGFKHKPGDRARRNRQFMVIAGKRRRFETADLPIISVDGKKRELIGNFKNGGRTWRRKARPVKDHDFPSDAEGVALPYGIYDVRCNSGHVVVGTSRETAEFAVDAIEHWWRRYGSKHHPGATELLILADSGGANSPRCKLWKCALQQKLCNTHGLRVTVCHYPPGASKWNPIEHRLFSEISKNWQGVPLETYDVALNYISTTQTKTGLTVSTTLNSKIYEKGREAAEDEMKLLNLRANTTLPEWNYTIKPYTQKQLRKMRSYF